VRFDAAMQLTHHATTMDLPGSANITTVAGDHALIFCRGTTSNKVVAYFRASGKALVETNTPVLADVGLFLKATGVGTAAYSKAIETGTVAMWMTETPPSGWLELDGSAISRTGVNADLFALFGTTYGIGNGTTTFNLPDMRGYFPRGWAHGSTVDPDKASRTDRGDATTGDHIGTKQADAFETHRHLLFADEDVSGLGGLDGSNQVADVGGTGTGSNTQRYIMTVSAIDATLGRSSAVGGNETRPTNINVMFIVKL
jgi:microcystin-dependent protein